MKLYLAYLLTWIHVLLIVVWLGVDLAVFSLSMGSIDRRQSMAVRMDRARTAQRFDNWVLKVFLLTTPLGLILVWIRGWELFATPWLSLKVALMGLIFLIAVLLVAGAAGTTTLLERISKDPAGSEALEAQLRRRVIRLAYPVWLLYSIIAVMIFIALSKELFY